MRQFIRRAVRLTHKILCNPQANLNFFFHFVLHHRERCFRFLYLSIETLLIKKVKKRSVSKLVYLTKRSHNNIFTQGSSFSFI